MSAIRLSRALPALRTTLRAPTFTFTQTRAISAFGYTQAKSLVFSEHGAPPKVLSLHSHSIPPAQDTDILVRFLASPINPADINQIEGVYPSRPPFTNTLGTAAPSAVPGNEGVVEIVSTGANVDQSKWKKGDRAIMRKTCFGTWRTHAIARDEQLMKIGEKYKAVADLQAAQVSVNPCTAYRMLKDFVPLKEGDWFIQNGANSGVGRAAIQLGRRWGLKSVNVVRKRDNFDELKADLEGLGADLVVTEEELGKELKQKLKELTGGKGIRLGLNCVGGKATTNLIRQLGDDAHLVTYGGMSKQPVTVPTGPFIFNDFHAHGFWVSRWSDRNPEEKAKMVDEIYEMMLEGSFKEAPVKEIEWTHKTNFEELKEAVEGSMAGGSGKKSVFVFKDT